MTEQQAYDVLREHPDFELRRVLLCTDGDTTPDLRVWWS